MSKSVLILGGIVEDRAQLLLSSTLFLSSISFARVVDKFLVSKEISNVWLNDSAKNALLNHPLVQYQQFNLLLSDAREAAFSLPLQYQSSRTGFDYVFDFTGESSFAASKSIHIERTFKISLLCGQTAEKSNVGVYVRGLNEYYKVLNGKGKVGDEGVISLPWGVKSIILLESLRALSKLSLNVIGVRMGIMYGENTTTGITKTLLLAESYKFKGKKFEFLFSEDAPQSCLHVDDFVSGLLAVANYSLRADYSKLAVEILNSALDFAEFDEIDGAAKVQEICKLPMFNLVSCTPTQKELSKLVGEAIDCKVGFLSSIISGMVKLNMEDMMEEVEERHSEDWSNLSSNCINELNPNSPLNPILPADRLQPYPIDFALERHSGWKSSLHSKLKKEDLVAMVQHFKKSGDLWPIPGKKKK